MLNKSVFLINGAILLASCGTKNTPQDKPNILWIILDDTGCDFSCYGNQIIQTPVFDSLAANGMLFTNMHVTAPVSSPARSALVTGMYQTSNGTHQHRSSRGTEMVFLDEDKPTIPELFRHEGYYTANVGYDYNPKTDYNFIWNPAMYDTLFRINEDKWVSPWVFREAGQPFFIQIQLEGGKNRRVSKRYPVDPSNCTPAPYYPDDSVYYREEASYHSSTLHIDKLLGDIMNHLHTEGLDKNTIVMILGDNGQDHYRDKQWLYDGGTHVPFIIIGPEKYVGAAGKVVNDLAIHIDMAPMSLAMAGLEIPDYLEGRNLFAKANQPRDFIVTARDRCDWTKDRIRAIRTQKYKYIRNYHPEYAYMQSNYRDEHEIVVRAKELFAQGKLNNAQAAFFKPTRPAEEFYVLGNDPFEISNQIDNPAYAAEIDRLRATLDQWIVETGDRGQYPETEVSYQQACKHVNTYTNHAFPIVAGVSALVWQSDSVSFTTFVTNNTDKKIEVTIAIKATNALKVLDGDQTIWLKPGEQRKLRRTALFAGEDKVDSLLVEISTRYPFRKNSQPEYRYHYKLKPVRRESISEGQPIVDGNAKDWEERLNHYFGKDGGVRFGIRQSKEFVYIGVMVQDEQVESVSGRDPWLQDGIEIRLDARPDPYRSSGIGMEDFSDHLLLAMSPSASNKVANLYLPANALKFYPKGFFENKLQYSCRVLANGYFTEVAVPLTLIRALQTTPEAIRLNLIVHNDGIDREHWQPQWGSEADFAGSGSFFLK